MLERLPVKAEHPWKCGMSIHLRNKTDRNKHMVTSTLCGSWKCPTCGPFLKRKWIEHLSRKLTESSDIYVSLISTSKWDTVSMRILRAGGQSATVKQTSGLMLVFTDAPQGEKITLSEALILLDKAINQAITDKRPIHTSRGWGLPKSKPKLSEWEKVEKLPVDVVEIANAVEQAGIKVTWFWTFQCASFVADLKGMEIYIDPNGQVKVRESLTSKLIKSIHTEN